MDVWVGIREASIRNIAKSYLWRNIIDLSHKKWKIKDQDYSLEFHRKKTVFENSFFSVITEYQNSDNKLCS